FAWRRRSAIDQDDSARALRMSNGKVQHHRRAPRVPHQQRRMSNADGLHKTRQVADDRLEVVTVVRLVTFAVAALIDRQGAQVLFAEPGADEIPDMAARSNTVHEQHRRCGVGFWRAPLLVVQTEPVYLDNAHGAT